MPPLAPNLSQAATLRSMRGWNNSSLSRRSNTTRGLLSSRVSQSLDTTSGGLINPPLPPSTINEATPRGATGSFSPRTISLVPPASSVSSTQDENVNQPTSGNENTDQPTSETEMSLTELANDSSVTSDNAGTYTVNDSYTLPAGRRLVINQGETLVISANATFTNSGSIENNGQLDILGTLLNEGQITNNAVVNQSGTVSGNGTFTGTEPVTDQQQDPVEINLSLAAWKTATENQNQNIVSATDDVTYTLIGDYTLDSGTTLTITPTQVLIINEGVTFTNNGTIENNGTIHELGTLTQGQGTLTGHGTLTNTPPESSTDTQVTLDALVTDQQVPVSQEQDGSYHLTSDYTLPSGKTLTINQGQIFYVDVGVTFTIEGMLVNEGTLNNQGSIVNNGTTDNNSIINNYGTITNNGVINGNPPQEGEQQQEPTPESFTLVTLAETYPLLVTTTDDISFNLIENFTLDSGSTLTINADQVLIINESVTFTNNGTIENNGTIYDYGTLTQGIVNGSGTITNTPPESSTDVTLDALVTDQQVPVSQEQDGSYHLTSDYTLPSGKTLTINQGQIFYVDVGVTFTIEGIVVNEGTLNNQGSIVNNGTTDNNSIINNYGTITNGGIINTATGATFNGNPVVEAQAPVVNQTISLSELYSSRSDLNLLTNDTANAFNMVNNYTLPLGTTLVIAEGENLTINNNVTFTINGSVTNNGTITISLGGAIVKSENVTGNVPTQDQTENTQVTLASLASDSTVPISVNPDVVDGFLMSSNYTLPAATTLTISNSESLIINDQVTFTIDGIVVNNGTITIAVGGAIVNSENVTGNVPTQDQTENTQVTLDTLVTDQQVPVSQDQDGSYHLTSDYTLPSGTTLTINQGQIFYVDVGVTFTIEGMLVNEGTLNNNGTVQNNGIISGAGMVIGSINGNQPQTVEGGSDVTTLTLSQLAQNQSEVLDEGANSFLIISDYTLPAGTELTIAEGENLTISDQVTFTIEGTINNNGTITNNGGIENNNEIANNGTINNNGAIVNNGIINNNGPGVISGNPPVEGGSGSTDTQEVTLAMLAADTVVPITQSDISAQHYTLDTNYTLPAGTKLTIAEGEFLLISQDAVFTNQGTIINNGTITSYNNIINEGTITNNFSIYYRAIKPITGDGTIDGTTEPQIVPDYSYGFYWSSVDASLKMLNPTINNEYMAFSIYMNETGNIVGYISVLGGSNSELPAYWENADSQETRLPLIDFLDNSYGSGIATDVNLSKEIVGRLNNVDQDGTEVFTPVYWSVPTEKSCKTLSLNDGQTTYSLHSYSTMVRINDGGKIISTVTDPSTSNLASNVRACYWASSDALLKILSLTDSMNTSTVYNWSDSIAINNSEEIVGAVGTGQLGEHYPAYWLNSDSNVKKLSLTTEDQTNYTSGYTNNINNNATIVGSVNMTGMRPIPALWTSPDAQNVKILSLTIGQTTYTRGQANSINDSGVIIGFIGYESNLSVVPVYWTDVNAEPILLNYESLSSVTIATIGSSQNQVYPRHIGNNGAIVATGPQQ